MSQRDPELPSLFDAASFYTEGNVSRCSSARSSPMPINPDSDDRSEGQSLASLVETAAYWRLRLRNIDPSTNQPLLQDHPNFLQPDPNPQSPWSDAEAKFYDLISQIHTDLLNSPTPTQALPLETLFPLAALLRISLDNRHPSTNNPLPTDSPYYNSPKTTPTWNHLDRCWHQIKDDVGKNLKPKLEYWVTASWVKNKAEELYQVQLQLDHLQEAILLLWCPYLGCSLMGQLTPRGVDPVFNPHYQQRNGQKSSLKGWLGLRLAGAVKTVAQKEAKDKYGPLRSQPVKIDPETGEVINPLDDVPDLRPAQPWWEIIGEAVSGPYAAELENIKPRSRKFAHINAKLVILKRLPPPVDWNGLAQLWGCHRTTLEHFYENHCVPWLKEHFPELKDLL